MGQGPLLAAWAAVLLVLGPAVPRAADAPDLSSAQAPGVPGSPDEWVHISNVDEREEWRRHSVLEGLTLGRIVGRGIEGYREALALLRSSE